MTFLTKIGEVVGCLLKLLACVVLGLLSLVLWRIDNEIPAVSASLLTTSAQVGGAASSVGAMSSALVDDAARLGDGFAGRRPHAPSATC